MITASADEVSVSLGGQIDLHLHLHFLSAHANANFQVLASGSGTGPIDAGIRIPLSYDCILQRCLNGTIPGAGQLYGQLNANSVAKITIRLNAGNWQGLIGRIGGS
ncbi:MAG: hypothetical protein HQ519_02170 [Planctomycetes bacterium]|nr:hypothetical protein [Planctomycetota bacterium]